MEPSHTNAKAFCLYWTMTSQKIFLLGRFLFTGPRPIKRGQIKNIAINRKEGYL